MRQFSNGSQPVLEQRFVKTRNDGITSLDQKSDRDDEQNKTT
jgi:hypothetical protein